MLKPLVKGRRVIAGTILGRIGKTSDVLAPHMLFEIRPAGRGAPRIDPKPILDGWKLLESTAIYRAQGKNPFFGENAQGATIGQILLMSKEALAQRVLANPRIEIYSCGRRDIEAGIVDRRVARGARVPRLQRPEADVTSLRCGHGFYTTSGNVSAHSSGNAVDIAKINGIPILGNQGAGSITDITVRRLLTLQGTMKPAQIITLMTYDGRGQHAGDGRPRRSHPRRLPPAVRSDDEGRQARRVGPQAVAVDQAHRPPRPDRQPDGGSSRRRSTRSRSRRAARARPTSAE